MKNDGYVVGWIMAYHRAHRVLEMSAAWPLWSRLQWRRCDESLFSTDPTATSTCRPSLCHEHLLSQPTTRQCSTASLASQLFLSYFICFIIISLFRLLDTAKGTARVWKMEGAVLFPSLPPFCLPFPFSSPFFHALVSSCLICHEAAPSNPAKGFGGAPQRIRAKLGRQSVSAKFRPQMKAIREPNLSY